MPASAECRDRPRFQKPTQITQARYARSQMNSACREVRSRRATKGLVLFLSQVRREPA